MLLLNSDKMYAKDIFNIIDELVPKKLALKDDSIGYFGKNFENYDVKSIKMMMDLLPEYDLKFTNDTLIIAHHPPLFLPKTPTYVVHSNWDVIKGGANDALASYLGLKPVSPFDRKTNIGRICSSHISLNEFLDRVCLKFGPENVRLVSSDKPNKILKKIALISGFGLSNKEYIKLANNISVDAFLSGDLNHSNAILAKKLELNIIDVPHHITEIPGLIRLGELIKNNEEIDIPIEVIDTGIPWKNVSTDINF